MRRLLVFLRRNRRKPAPVSIDAERLHRIYRETHRHVEDLRKAA